MEFRIKFWPFAIIGLYGCWTLSLMAAQDHRKTEQEVLLCAIDTPTELIEIICKNIRFLQELDQAPYLIELLSKAPWLKKLIENKTMARLSFPKNNDTGETILLIQGDESERDKAVNLLRDELAKYTFLSKTMKTEASPYKIRYYEGFEYPPNLMGKAVQDKNHVNFTLVCMCLSEHRETLTKEC